MSMQFTIEWQLLYQALYIRKWVGLLRIILGGGVANLVKVDSLVTHPRAVFSSQNVVPFSLNFHKGLF